MSQEKRPTPSAAQAPAAIVEKYDPRAGKAAQAPAAAAEPAKLADAASTPQPATVQPVTAQPTAAQAGRPVEIGGPSGPEPTRYGDWERNGRVSDF